MNFALPLSAHRRLSIRAQLLALVLAVALPAFALVGYNVFDAANEAREVAHERVRAVAQEVAGRLELVLRDNEALLAGLAERPRIRALDARDCEPIIAEFVDLHPDYTTLGLRDRDANAVCTFLRPALGAERVRAYPWFDEGVRRGRFMVGDAFFGPQSGRWVMPLTHPVRDASGNVQGLLLVTLDLLALQQRVLGGLPDDTIVVMFDRDNRYLMRSLRPADWIGKPLPRAQLDRLPARTEDAFELTGVDGVTRLNAGAVVASTGWRVYAGLPRDQVLAAHRTRVARSVAAGMVVLLLALGLAYAIGSAIARPIRDLARAASEMADGGMPAVGAIEGAAEIQAAAGGLHRLTGERAQYREARAALSAHYDQLIKMARDIVLLSDPAGHIVEANDAAIAAYGYGADELRAMQVGELRPSEVQATTERDWQASARAEGALFESVHRRKDGSTFPVEISARAIEVAGRLYRQSFVRDISERKHAEALLLGQNRVLELIAQRAPLRESLEAAVHMVEARSPGMLASILLLDDDGIHVRHGAAPSLPEAFVRAVDGSPIGPRAGSCGTAIHRGEPVIVADIETDPLWDDYRQLAAPHGLRACWSTPIVDAKGRVLGSFAMYFRQPGRPDARLVRLVEVATHTAVIAIMAEQTRGQIRAQLEELLHWQELTIGREERMRELKAEVNELLAQQGRPIRYPGEAES